MFRPVMQTYGRYMNTGTPRCRSPAVSSYVKNGMNRRWRDDQWCSVGLQHVQHHHIYSSGSNRGSSRHTILNKHFSPKTHSGFQSQNAFLSTSKTSDIHPVKSIGYRFPDWTVSYTSRDVILYALGVGVSSTQSDYLKFLYEKSDDFSVVPSYAVIPPQKVILELLHGEIPGLENIDPTKVLHGEQYLEVYGALPTTGTLRNKGVVVDVLDKRSGALVLIDVHTHDHYDNRLVAYNQFALFVGGAGGFGGGRTSDHIKPTVRTPSTEPEISVTQTTSLDQAALYRLNGDDNPLHIDPETAKRGGFPRSISHGLCTFGFALRHVLQHYADNDVSKVKQVKARFSKPVFPGQTIQTDMWRERDRVFFQCKVSDTGDVVITGAYVDLCNMD